MKNGNSVLCWNIFHGLLTFFSNFCYKHCEIAFRSFSEISFHCRMRFTFFCKTLRIEIYYLVHENFSCSTLKFIFLWCLLLPKLFSSYFFKCHPEHFLHFIFFQTIEGFVFSPIKCFLSSVLTLISGSLFLILLTWRSDIKLNCLYKKVRLQEADKVLLKVQLPFTIV